MKVLDESDCLQIATTYDGTPINAAYCSDCFEILPTLPNNCIDLAIMDLPYATKKRGYTANKWDIEFHLPLLWEQLNQVCKKGAPMIFTCNAGLLTKLIASNEVNFKYELIWVKNRSSNFLQAKRQPLTRHEFIAVFYRSKPVYNPQFSYSNKLYNASPGGAQSDNYKAFRAKHSADKTGRRYPDSILFIPHDKELSQNKRHNKGKLKRHPTQKPVGLYEYIIKTYTNEGGTVLDPTAGTLTAAIAAINTNRNYIVCERLESYYEIGLKRIEKRISDKGNELKFEKKEENAE